MAGGSDEITGDESLEELRAKLDEDFKLGVAHKIGSDSRLDFTAVHGTVVGDAINDAFKNGTLLEWVVNNSDTLAEEVDDKTNSTYKRSAAQIANLILKYIGVGNAWEKLVSGGKYEDNKLERFLGSHQTVPESFLAKIVELTKGSEERDRLIDVLDKNGFKFSEGYEIKIKNHQGRQPTLHLSFHRENEDKPDDDRLRSFDLDEDVGYT